MKQTRSRFGLALGLALGCCLAFTPQTSSAQEAVGRWKGSWSSAGSGHRGALGATIRPAPDGSLQARFVGRFAAVIPFVYRADLEPVAGCPGQYTSSKRLPVLGEYQMRAHVAGDSFQATFQGGRDVGVFQMTRR